MSGAFSKLMAAVSAFRKVWSANDLDLISAGVAFYGLFSIFPAIAASIAVFGLIADPVVIYDQLNLLREFIPADVFNLLRAQVNRLLSAESTTLGWASIVSLGIALWSARAGVGALIRGLNAITGVQSRSGVRHLMTAVGLTAALIGVGIVALIMVVIAPVVIAFVPLASKIEGLLLALRWVVALLVLLIALGLLYRYGPNGDGVSRGRIFTVGSVVAVVLWYGASWLFSYYLANFGNYNEVYGSIGAVAAMLMWLYISSYLVLLGCVLNVALLRIRA
ncbi:ribonuclease BN [Marivivens niveibacter]|uniref:Ribonuclease BN n=2 Tax=Marivivens niveibacter TaxID=1930667 RepID=A0A251X2C6_9RHOB|nr:ribonuclease BN [Marivivens niveibacter]